MKQNSPDPDEFKNCFNAVNESRDLSAHCVARLLETRCQDALMYSDYELFAGLFFEQSREAPLFIPPVLSLFAPSDRGAVANRVAQGGGASDVVGGERL